MQVFLLGPTILMSQSYPKYYQAGLNCSWLVRVPPHQRVVTRVLDLQLGDSTTSCEDKLQIEDTVLDCGELQSESHVLSRGPNSLIQFHTGDTAAVLELIYQIRPRRHKRGANSLHIQSHCRC